MYLSGFTYIHACIHTYLHKCIFTYIHTYACTPLYNIYVILGLGGVRRDRLPDMTLRALEEAAQNFDDDDDDRNSLLPSSPKKEPAGNFFSSRFQKFKDGAKDASKESKQDLPPSSLASSKYTAEPANKSGYASSYIAAEVAKRAAAKNPTPLPAKNPAPLPAKNQEPPPSAAPVSTAAVPVVPVFSEDIFFNYLAYYYSLSLCLSVSVSVFFLCFFSLSSLFSILFFPLLLLFHFSPFSIYHLFSFFSSILFFSPVSSENRRHRFLPGPMYPGICLTICKKKKIVVRKTNSHVSNSDTRGVN